MKKLLSVLMLVILMISLIACEKETGHTHDYQSNWESNEVYHWKLCADAACESVTAKAEHTWHQISDDEQGNITYACDVCATEKEVHTHVYAEEMTSNSTHHWYACVYESCNGIDGKEEHAWDDGTTVVAPTSEQEGVLQYLCEDCGVSKKESIEKLPSKMSREDWKSAFDIQNVQIENTVSMGGIGNTKSTCLVDGEQVELIEESMGNTFSDRSLLKDFDFSEHYDLFVHIGDDVYTAEKLTLYLDGIYCDYTDCVVTFRDGKLLKISYRLEMVALFGTIAYTFEFSKWGEISLEVPKLTAEELDVAFATARFEQNFTMSKTVWDETGDGTFTEISVVDDIYTYEISSASGDMTDSGYASAEGFADSLIEEMRSIVDLFDLSAFQYDSYLGFVSNEKVKNYNGRGDDLVNITIMIENGYLMGFDYEEADGKMVSYYFSDYEDMPVSDTIFSAERN